MGSKAQKWECPRCGYTYESPIPAFEVLCPKDHLPANGRGRIGRQPMTLIAGSPALPRKAKKKENSSGKKAGAGT